MAAVIPEAAALGEALRRTPRTSVDRVMETLRSDREHLPTLISGIEQRLAEERAAQRRRPVDTRRAEILSRLLELLRESSMAKGGVLQSTVLSMCLHTLGADLPIRFFSPTDIDAGCVGNPGLSVTSAMELGVDDRLCLTVELFEAMVAEMTNVELDRLLDMYSEYIEATDVAWQISALERHVAESPPRIACASGIAVCHTLAYVADAEQHVIFMVNLLTNEITELCGACGKPGLRDGSRHLAQFNSPSGLAICEASLTLYVCDTGNDVLRLVSVPSGVVRSLPAMCTDVRMHTPVCVCIVRGDFEHDWVASDDDSEDEVDKLDTDGEERSQDGKDDVEEGVVARIGTTQLEGITEEGEEIQSVSSCTSDNLPGYDDVPSRLFGRHASDMTPHYSLGSRESVGRNKFWAAAGTSRVSKSVKGSSFFSSRSSRRTLGSASSSVASPRDSRLSVSSSARASRFSSISSESWKASPRQTMRMTMAESAETSLRACAHQLDQGRFSLAVVGDHCVYMVNLDKREIIVLAGSPTEYGYKDADRGRNAKFSSLKGIVCVGECLFVADHWNNAIRCINLETTQVDTVIDFEPCGPIALTVSSSGSVYVVDSEKISVCNILKICSSQRVRSEEDNPLGTRMFQFLQYSALSPRTSAPAANQCDTPRHSSKRNAIAATANGFSSAQSRRALNQPGKGLVSSLGPRVQGPSNSKAAFPRRRRALKPSESAALDSSITAMVGQPVLPRALRLLLQDYPLHPSFIHMVVRTRGDQNNSPSSNLEGGANIPHEDLLDDGSEVAFLNPKGDSPWKLIPIGTLQEIYQDVTGHQSASSPLSLVFWDAAAEGVPLEDLRNPQRLLLGSDGLPSLIKICPPRKAPAQDTGRFRAVAVDMDRIIMADRDSHQVFVLNHAKRTKDKIAGCGKAGYFDGPLDVCRMRHPSSVALDPKTHYIYVADTGNHRVRCIDLSTGFMRTVCGNGRRGTLDGAERELQSLDGPFDLKFMHPCHLLISCADNSIRKFDLQTSVLETILIGG